MLPLDSRTDRALMDTGVLSVFLPLLEIRCDARVRLHIRAHRLELWEGLERELEHRRERVMRKVEQVHVRQRRAVVAQEELAEHARFEHAEGARHRVLDELGRRRGLLVRVRLRVKRDERREQVAQRLGHHVDAEGLDRVLRVQPASMRGVSSDREALREGRAVHLEHGHLAERQRRLKRRHVCVLDAMVYEPDAAEREEQTRELSATRALEIRELELWGGAHGVGQRRWDSESV
ncbi:hypothetical protein PybrP1_002554 [[Pythium] brassicae (nom. inval.)]|nr:hypothetical protein PybrP1_002554 [[Pythium] brassicae (nom. inval.)]